MHRASPILLPLLGLLAGCPPEKPADASETGNPDGCVVVTWYTDADGDGFGDETTDACERPEGVVTEGGDCDDADPAVHPGAMEACNGADDDCDGSLDDGLATSVWYGDADGDGSYGGDPIEACAQPDATGETAEDCDDADATRYPGAAETCDGIDDDCDDLVDDADPDVVTEATFYRDADGDGVGLEGDTIGACAAPEGYATVPGDCDDQDDAIKPGVTDACNAADDDCDGEIDEDAAVNTYYRDADGDRYGDPASSTTACALPSGYDSDALDCNDADAQINPRETELCDGLDQDCDGDIDEDGACDTGFETGTAAFDWVGTGEVTAGAWTTGTFGASFLSRRTGASVCDVIGEWYEDAAAPRRLCPSCDWGFDLNTRDTVASGSDCTDFGMTDGVLDDLHYGWGFATTAVYSGYALENVIYLYYSRAWTPFSFNYPGGGTYEVTGDQYAFSFEHPTGYYYYHY